MAQLLAPLNNTVSYGFFTLINTLGETVSTSHHWPLGDEGKQAKKFWGAVRSVPLPGSVHGRPLSCVALCSCSGRPIWTRRGRTALQIRCQYVPLRLGGMYTPKPDLLSPEIASPKGQ